MKEARLVLVRFVDVIGRPEWDAPSDHLEHLSISLLGHMCVGWILRDDKDGIVVTATRAEDWRTVNDVTFIPRSAVISVVDLVEGSK